MCVVEDVGSRCGGGENVDSRVLFFFVSFLFFFSSSVFLPSSSSSFFVLSFFLSTQGEFYSDELSWLVGRKESHRRGDLAEEGGA